ncbi:MAG: VacJ family lipoprotein, partial [Mycobacterium sp.]|nr:VacJ family lipoprotein [Mycobacterium sp.]
STVCESLGVRMGVMRTIGVLGLAGLLLVGVAGCATPPPASDPDAVAEFKQTNDPLEPTNRVMYTVNEGLDTMLIRPLAIGYTWVVPEYVRGRIHNMLSNLNSPVLLANDMMQGKPRRAGDTLMRFVINSTVGLAGIFDVATDWGYPYHSADFGETLALWGVPDGPYLFLPILGPGNPRDSSGYGVDVALDPMTWVGINNNTVADIGYARYGLTLLDVRSGLFDTLDKATAQALDPYATVRSLYRQHRAAEIEAVRQDTRATPSPWYPTPANH